MKKKNGFISMALVYSFLVIFLFIMSSIINVYLRKNAYLEALESQVGEDIGITKESRATLISKILESNVSQLANNIDYTKISAIDNGNGVYYLTDGAKIDENNDDAYTRIYFFRGNVDNNVVYGTETDGTQASPVCWKIIRTNDNGTIRLIYNGKLDPSYGCTGTPYITGVTKKFNEFSNDNAYVGFSYGKVGATSYNETHRNDETQKSTIRNTLEDWIENKFQSNITAEKSADTIYCNDRRIYNLGESLPTPALNLNVSNPTGFNNNETVYKGYGMLSNNVSYMCNESNDRYALKTSFINNAGNINGVYNSAFDKNPIALPTIADIVYAGGAYNQANTNYFLNAGTAYWTMTPAFYSNNSGANMFIVSSNGAISTSPTDNNNNIEIRPVISINGDIKVNAGYGTKEEPYILE